MGGEGAMMAMAATLKNNNNLKSKRKERGGLSGSYANVKMQEFPKATPKMLEAIKAKTIQENKKARIKQLVVLIGAIVIVGIVFFYVSKN